MKFGMYAIRDVLSGFMTPVLESNDAVAMRNFRMATDTNSGLMHYRPSDFALYHIADFDAELGVLTPIVPPVVVCNGGSQDAKV